MISRKYSTCIVIIGIVDAEEYFVGGFRLPFHMVYCAVMFYFGNVLFYLLFSSGQTNFVSVSVHNFTVV